MKSRLSSTVWTLVLLNLAALFIVLGLAFSAGKQSNGASIFDIGKSEYGAGIFRHPTDTIADIENSPWIQIGCRSELDA